MFLRICLQMCFFDLCEHVPERCASVHFPPSVSFGVDWFSEYRYPHALRRNYFPVAVTVLITFRINLVIISVAMVSELGSWDPD